MARNYKTYKYFDNRPDIVKIFDDLEDYLNFCRMELFPFNPADLYQKANWTWRKFEASRNPKKQKKKQPQK